MAVDDVQVTNYNATTPAAPSGAANVVWQADAPGTDPTVARNASAYLPAATATTPGGVPTPPNDVTKVLRGDMTYGAPVNVAREPLVESNDVLYDGTDLDIITDFV